MYHQPPPTVRYKELRTLKVRIFDTSDHDKTGQFTCWSFMNKIRAGTKTVTLLIAKTMDIVDYAKSLLTASNITTFSYSFCYYFSPTHILILQQILDHLPDLDRVSLYLTTRFDQIELYTRHYNNVKHLELNGNSEVDENQVDVLTSMFPKIKYLKLNYFSGVWKEDSKEYQIQLHDLALERLYLDISPIFMKVKPFSLKVGGILFEEVQTTENSEGRLKDDYFLLDVKTTENSEHRIFKVALDYVSVVEINDVEARELDKVIRVVILVDRLQFITMCLYKDVFKVNPDQFYIQNRKSEVIEGTIRLV
jgi:hypothetical protein